MAEIAVVELSAQERALYDAIRWDAESLLRQDDGERVQHLERMGQLAESLLARGAIPAVRVAYFTDPAMNVGGSGKSRKEVFEKNGTADRDIFRHPHFIDYLRYFIHGPDLPRETIEGFWKILDEDRGTSGMVHDQLRAYVRKEVRDRGLTPGHAADEFFKLAYEMNMPPVAESVRSAARQVRK